MSPSLAATDKHPDNEAVNFNLSRQELLALQIRAFLDASEDVDLSPEVAEDLLATLPADEDEDTDENEAHPFASPDMHDGETVEITAFNGEIDIWRVFNPFHIAETTWTKQEVKQMLHHLKERGAQSFIAEYVTKRDIPIPKLLHAFGIDLSLNLLDKSRQTMLYFLQVAMSFQLRLREKLTQYNTISDALELIRQSERILILTGAGISVSCGIPDFRSRNGLYATLKERGDYDLDDPQQMFDIAYFRENPSVFYSFASQIYPSNFVPSPCHRFIKLVEDHGKLLRNYTQNIDTLETIAGVQRVLQCHGSFATASCLLCRRQVPGAAIETEVLSQKVPLCPVCNIPADPPGMAKKPKRKKGKKEWEESESEDDHRPQSAYPPGIMKPDITFFGEKLDDSFDTSLAEDRDKVDLLLVIGTSLKVSPVADILSHLPHSIPQILINKTPIRHINPDIVLLGNADDIISHLANGLGWEIPPAAAQPTPARMQVTRANLKRRLSSDSKKKAPERVADSHVWLFEGAEGGRWLEDFQQVSSTPGQSVTGGKSPKPADGQDTEGQRQSKKTRV